MLQRVHYYVTNQNFCDVRKSSIIPPEDISYVTSRPGDSCIAACDHNALLCEPSYFDVINTAEILQKHASRDCNGTYSADNDVIYPAISTSMTSQCVTQNDPLLFSCAGQNSRFVRLCPCRTFIQDQSAICKRCL